ncbi:MAG TPA: polysaccharide deacetylase family protein [Segetibacter sp.]
MYREAPYTGEELEPKCLCLTYDDGPGKNTYEIAKFLHEQEIQATFFVVGKYAIHYDEILKEVSAMGHLIANHTYEHPDLPYYLSRNGDVQNQIIRTDAVIRNYNKKSTIYFRSPYGKWSREVAKELNTNLLSNVGHIGPIYWDIAGIDCYYWKTGVSVEEAVQKYLQDIREKDHGVVVMHDEIADMDFLKIKNKTLELTKQLIPILKTEGYKFVRLDEIESIKKDASKLLSVTLKTSGGKFLYLSDNSTIQTNQKKSSSVSEFGVRDLGNGQFAFNASNGLFLSFNPSHGNLIEANAKEIKEYETFDLIPLYSNKVLLRANNGNYLKIETTQSGSIAASSEFMRGGEIFTIMPTGLSEKRKFSLIKEIRSLKRQFLYIKSKIKQGT